MILHFQSHPFLFVQVFESPVLPCEFSFCEALQTPIFIYFRIHNTDDDNNITLRNNSILALTPSKKLARRSSNSSSKAIILEETIKMYITINRGVPFCSVHQISKQTIVILR